MNEGHPPLDTPPVPEPHPLTEAALSRLLRAHLEAVDRHLNGWSQAVARSLALRRTPLPPGPIRFDQPGWALPLGATIDGAGALRLNARGGTIELISPLVSVPGACLLGLRFEAGEASGLVLRVLDDAGLPLCAEIALAAGALHAAAYVPAGCRAVRIVLRWAGTGAALHLARFEPFLPDSDAWQAAQRQALGVPVVASISSGLDRVAQLHDAVSSLLPQCDRIRVFLDGDGEVPPILSHPRVEIRRSSDFDVLGPLGRFSWHNELDAPGYRLALDDRLIYPADFAAEMVAGCRRSNDQAFVGLAGALLRQPQRPGAHPASWWLAAENGLAADRGMHLLSTGTLCWHSAHRPFGRGELKHRGSLDVQLALLAQRQAIPMVALARPTNWVQGPGTDPATTPRDDAGLDGRVPLALLRRAWPVTIQPSRRAKLVLCLVVAEAKPAAALLGDWVAQAGTGYDWAVILCPIGEGADLWSWAETAALPAELHLAGRPDMPASLRLTSALMLAQRLGAETLCVVTDALRVEGGTWIGATLGALAGAGGAALFGHADPDGRLQLSQNDGGDSGLPALIVTPMGLALAAGDADPGFRSATAALRDWARRLHLAQSRSSSGRVKTIPDVSRDLRAVAAPAAGSVDREPAIAGPDARARVGWLHIPSTRPDASIVQATGLGDLFERIVVINLDRRPDRWRRMQARLARAGIAAGRVAAVDGHAPEVLASYAAYAAQPIRSPPPGVREVRSTWQFSRDYDSQAARVAFEERRLGRKAIGSAGAWAYLLTWQGILEQAIEDGVETLLVLDDDVVFHHALSPLIDTVRRELPKDWLVLQLGTLQHNWDTEALTRISRHLYRTDGAAVGSHAVGLSAAILPFLLDLVERRELPFDIGPLAAGCLAFREHCLAVLPNAAIQTLEDSDIGTSSFQHGRSPAEAAAAYRWHLPDYDL
ncbi:glycosyltransferase family 25 protein [Falsiroseomonas sp. E2-1-a20]|uniref:glycosyltransferase family 25 protein n=1 Tax=Falsiroseomonas sp. E2-1-a20 TaxID=3239300 RepID=UPI003F3779E3